MSHTEISMEKPKSNQFTVDVGEGDVFLGKEFDRPWFFDSLRWKMMKEWSPEYVHIKTWKGEIYQFRLYRFHSRPAMLITSTLQDTFIVFSNALGLKKTMNVARRAKRNKIPIEGSVTGYSTWGLAFEEQYTRLKANMKKQHIYFSDDALVDIYNELVRRNNEENERNPGSRRKLREIKG